MDNETDISLKALGGTKFDTYWLDSLGEEDVNPALDEDIDCDLLVVGGGFCGLWAAIQARELDPARHVAVIEAKAIANGASGVIISKISPESRLHGKLLIGDQIQVINGKRVQDSADFLTRLIASAAVQSTELLIKRGERKFRISISRVASP